MTGQAAIAQEIVTSVFADMRYRYEQVHQPDARNTAEGQTVRLNIGGELRTHDTLSFLAEFENVVVLQEPGDPADRALLPDDSVSDLNRLQASWRQDGLNIVIGRQDLALDNERFLGGVGFRQNNQTYDAARLVYASDAAWILEAAFIWRVNRFGAGADQARDFVGESWLVDAVANTPLGKLRGYVYALDLGDRGTEEAALSNLSTGASLMNTHKIGQMRLNWRLEAAHQQDYADAPFAYDSAYWRVDLGAERDRIGLSLAAEHYDAGFQTPLGTNHAFLGEADGIAPRPDAGLEDVNIGIVWRAGSVSPLRNIQASLRHHWFSQDDFSANIGEEWDVSLAATIAGFRVTASHANFTAESPAQTIDKTWITIERSF